MKKVLALVLLIVVGFSATQCVFVTSGDKDQKASVDSARIEFENPNHDFGEINEGEVVSTTYKFKNTGSMPLQIFNVEVSCGCTVASKPEEPIGVGKTGEIKVEFNSAGKVGINKKYVTVTSNAVNSTEAVSFDVIVNQVKE